MTASFAGLQFGSGNGCKAKGKVAGRSERAPVLGTEGRLAVCPMLLCSPRFGLARGSLGFGAVPEPLLGYQPGPAPLTVEVAPRFELEPDDAPQSFIESEATLKTKFKVSPGNQPYDHRITDHPITILGYLELVAGQQPVSCP